MKSEIRPGGTHLAYTDKALDLHTDLTYYNYSPGVCAKYMSSELNLLSYVIPCAN